ncbi:DDX49 [Acanthosepion pharaonis]|uniref:DDX49 n=1 Tax=Acanthosepion pharaonis TaxID=158019 RepID=A0A812AP56_ACAPH|nr:DDX49 [Sepia pharaonis]
MIFNDMGFDCVVLHSMMTQQNRLAALAKFKSSQVRILIATDVASRLQPPVPHTEAAFFHKPLQSLLPMPPSGLSPDTTPSNGSVASTNTLHFNIGWRDLENGHVLQHYSPTSLHVVFLSFFFFIYNCYLPNVPIVHHQMPAGNVMKKVFRFHWPSFDHFSVRKKQLLSIFPFLFQTI